MEESAWKVVLDHVRACLPQEACGLLGGHGTDVGHVAPVENIERSSFRYRMEPKAQIEAMLGLERAGYELLGIYHSHPHGPGSLSPTDLLEARYPECAYIVISPHADTWRGRAFRVESGRGRRIRLEIVASTTE
jgi:proteasome lid subunit RPN8/RPN11